MIGNVCVPCEECDTELCNHSTGQCIGMDDALHVDGDGGTPYTTLQDALLAYEGSKTIILHQWGTDKSYSFTEADYISVDSYDLSIIAAPGDRPSVLYLDTDPDTAPDPYFIDVRGAQGSLYLSGFLVIGTRGVFIDDDAKAYIDSMYVTTEQSAVRVQDGEAVAFNSMFQTGGDNRPTIEVETNGNFMAGFSSIVKSTDGNDAALKCGGPAALRNSLLGKIDDSTVINCNYDDLGGNYVATEVIMKWDWFSMGDLHLGAYFPAEVATSASWMPGDPPWDIDGDARPMDDATHAGADIPQP